jgi:hypothetical protein
MLEQQPDLITQFNNILEVHNKTPEEIIASVVALSNQASDQFWENMLENRSDLKHLQDHFAKIYYDYILAMEINEVDMLSRADTGQDKRFTSVASPAAITSYERVEDVFSELSLEESQTFVVVGGGHLPVTAIHAIEKVGIKQSICLDISEQTVESVNYLKDKFSWNQLEGICCDGCDYDYSDADVVYIANMVKPKRDVLNRVIDTVKSGTPIIVREPYSLGMLWTDTMGYPVPDALCLKTIGPGSVYLSRDVFLGWK